MIFSAPFTVDFHDTDLYARMRPSAALKYMQEAANLHLNAYGPTMDELRAGGRAFLLSRIRMAIRRPLPAYTPIEAQTWVAMDDHGYSFNRYHRLIADGETAAEAMSVWALVDLETRRPIRASEFTYNFSGDLPLDIELPRRIRFPAAPEIVGERRVVYSDCDYNGHINNTRYPDLLCDFLPAGEARRVKDVVINFLGEAPLGDTLTVFRTPDPERNGRYLFRTRRADGSTNIEAVLTLAANPQ
ncbi:MAG: hypothetical protein IJC15_05780 [Clostridia bacterium]|nr:hypothetical protein [Clostridia bacterium]